MKKLLAIFRDRKLAVLFLLGFASGVPLMLTGQVMQARLEDAGIDIKAISAFASVGLPYTFKWLWAPVFDRFTLPLLGRRRGWLLVFQLALVAAIFALGLPDPRRDMAALVALSLALAALSASQDVVADAYAADALEPARRAAGSAVYVVGYRLGMLVAGTLTLVVVDLVGWRVVYAGVAAFMLVGVAGTLLAREPAGRPPSTFAAAVITPVVDLVTRRRALVILAFVALYKFGDHMAQASSIVFLKQVGFSNADVGLINKALGFAGTAVGGLIAGITAPRVGIRKLLVLFGVLQATTNVLYGVLAGVGKSYPMFATAAFVDFCANAMGTAVFVAYLMSLVNHSVSAGQYAILTSLSSVGQRVFGWVGGLVQHAWGWTGFWAVTALLALPGLLLVPLLPYPNGSSDSASRSPSLRGTGGS